MPEATSPEVYSPLTVGEWLLYLVGIPLVFIVIVALLHLAPGWTRGGRHRPGQSWDVDPYFADGSDGAAPALSGAATAADAPEHGEDRGSSARW